MDYIEQVEDLFKKHGFSDFKWVSGKNIKVSQWVRFKCIYGCNSYGKKSTCPPNVPTVSECERFFSEYESAVIVHFKRENEDKQDLASWCKAINIELSKIEKDIFLAGFYKAFAIFVDECNLCVDCVSERSECRNKKIARPCTEALAVDVYGTVTSIGYPIKVINGENDIMNRYAIVLIK